MTDRVSQTVASPLFGMRVIESMALSREPKLKVRSDVPMSPAARAAMNAWLLERFGDQEVAYIMDMSALLGRFDRQIADAFGMPERTLIGSPLTIERLSAACKLVMP